jgi:4-methyl-5(b-hydroxyethyl)-thiazole monophosphate biosynthesis
MMLSKNILVPIARGIEEIETVTIIDVLRRAGISVRVSSIEEREVIGAHGIKIVADSDFSDEAIEDYDGIVLPGGSEGAKRFAECTPLITAIKKLNADKELIAALCASPAVVLTKAGVLNNKKATGYPSFKNQIKNYVDEKVVIDGNIVTSQGPGTAMVFALRLVEILADKKTASEVKAQMLA